MDPEGAEAHNYDCIITRNKNDYKKLNLKVFTPEEFLKEIKNKKEEFMFIRQIILEKI